MLVILSGVSGAGKDTVKKELMNKMEDVITLPSYTSREPRDGEQEGVEYHFISKDEFKDRIEKNEFYEYDVHHENYYGTSRRLMNEKIESGKIIIKDIEVNGTENLINILKNEIKLITIFLKVDEQELRSRLEKRGESKESIDLRLSRLEYEESKIGLYDYVIKNDDLEKTVDIIMTILKNEKRLEKRREAGRLITFPAFCLQFRISQKR